MAAAIAAAGMALLPTSTRADDTPGFTTISLSGSTAMRNFTIGSSTGSADSGLTMLPNGTTITLNGTTYGPFSNTGGFQELAPFNNPAGAINSTGTASQLRIEWYENGAAEGIRDLVNSWNGTGFAPNFNGGNNPVWVNRTKFTAYSATPNSNGWTLTNMNPVQMSISDMNAKQAFSTAGTPAFNRPVGAAGYGLGNPLAPVPQPILSPSLFNNVNTGGLALVGTDKTDNKVVGMQTALFVANPGTGMSQLNRTDAQFLETTGHLKNGLGFEVALRDQYSGTHNVVNTDIGVDPSWGIGVADGDSSGKNSLGNLGFSNKSTGGNLRTTVRISRMSIGELGNSDANTNTLATSTNPIRALSYSDSADGSTAYVPASAATLTDGSYAMVLNETYVTLKTDANPSGIIASADPGNAAGIQAAANVKALRDNILGSISNFPNPNTANTPADRLLSQGFVLPQMMLKAQAINGVGATVGNLTSDPRTGLSFAAYDETRIFDSTLPASYVDSHGVTETDQKGTLRDILLNSSDPNVTAYRNKFVNDAPTSVKQGTSSTYGAGATAFAVTNATPIDGTNYFYGNFNANFVRDLSALRGATLAQTAMENAGVTKSYFDGVASQTPNTTSVTYTDAKGVSRTFSKGSLITMGDFNGDGLFDGKDLYLFAKNAAASDASGTGFANGTVTTNGGGIAEGNFGDVVRSAVLRKNAALDYLQANASIQQKTEAAVNGTAMAISNAFNKFDVNHDGKVNLYDTKIVKMFGGKKADDISDETSAVVSGSTSGLAGPSGSRIVSLYDAIFTDGNTTVNASLSAGSDLRLIQAQTLGDMNLDGVVDGLDINPFILALANPTNWASNYPDIVASDVNIAGDMNHDGVFDGLDINGFISALAAGNASAAELAPLYALAVPEPTSLTLLGLGAGFLLARRKRK